MNKKGSVNYKGRIYNFEIDKQDILWIIKNDYQSINFGKMMTPLNDNDRVEEVVYEMLKRAGH